MTTVLTPRLLRFLIGEGYQFCLSKFTTIQSATANVCLTLKPVKGTPVIKHKENFDTFFAIKAEPVYLANGVDRTLILVDISTATVLKYRTSLFHNAKKTPRQPHN